MSKDAIAAQGPLDRGVRARFWMTKESEWRLAKGGNSKGAVPVHGKPSATATVPLYDQAALDAAVAADRLARSKKKDKRVTVELRLPNETLHYLNSVAVLAGVSTEQVVNVILAFDAMRHRIAEASAGK